VPRQGYILVQPGTAEEERLRLCWTSAERPERHFVPYTYVEACKIAGMLLKQIFVHDGLPIKMHIHPSIANVNARTALSHRIMVSPIDYISLLHHILLASSTLAGIPLPPHSLPVSSSRTPTLKSSNTLSRSIRGILISISNLICG
jgi:hypothetical protein